MKFAFTYIHMLLNLNFQGKKRSRATTRKPRSNLIINKLIVKILKQQKPKLFIGTKKSSPNQITRKDSISNVKSPLKFSNSNSFKNESGSQKEIGFIKMKSIEGIAPSIVEESEKFSNSNI